jgi:hypothetical protein
MKRRSVLASMGAFTASGSLVMGSGAFTSAEAERDVDVDVVGDENAFLGLVYDDIEVEDPPDRVATEVGPPRAVYEETLVELLNQFSTDITVDEFTIEVETDDDVEVDFSDSPSDPEDSDCEPAGKPNGEGVPKGECLAVRADIECPPVRTEGHSATVYFDVAVSGTGISAETTESREVEVECPKTTDSLIQSLDFSGSGNVHFDLPDGPLNLLLDVWLIDKDDGSLYQESHRLTDVKNGVTLKSQNIGDQRDTFAAVYVADVNTTYVHPGLKKKNNGWKVTGSGPGVPQSGTLDEDSLLDSLSSL